MEVSHISSLEKGFIMGFQDRDYYREVPQWSKPRKEHSALFYIIILNVIIWLCDSYSGGKISGFLALRAVDFPQWTHWYRFLTYGFCHDTSSIWHLFGNMLGLFFLGQYVEMKYGKWEFLCFYLVSILVGGLYWSGTSYVTLLQAREALSPVNLYALAHIPLVGASGGVTAVVILFAFNFPRVTIYIWGILPIPAFLFGILLVGMDLAGAQQSGSNVAHSVHLAGAAFAILYYFSKVRIASLLGLGNRQIRNYNSGNRFRFGFGNSSGSGSNGGGYVDRDDEYEDDSYGYAPASRSEEETRNDQEFQNLQADVERLLKKISEQGMQSLTPAELQRLREASQKYRTRR